jgi:hypothetical protein
MELEEFITTALLDITKGVDKAHQISNRFQLSGQVHARGTSGESVEFDIGLEVSRSKGAGVKGGISVATIGVGAEAKAHENYQQTHRLKFKIFVTEK